MFASPVAASSIKKINADGFIDTNDLLAAEEPMEIRVGFGNADQRMQKNISVTMRTPGNDFELAIGFLFTEGIIKNYNDILQIKYCNDFNRTENHENIVRVELKENIEFDFEKFQRNFYTTSSCGVCGKSSIDAVKTILPESSGLNKQASGFRIPEKLIRELPARLSERQNIFRHTGGLHASALFDIEGQLIFLREDIGRHNALDKLIGAALAGNILPLNNHILLLSGRTSFELVQKAAMAGIKMVAAIGAPSALAVKTAKEFDITLIGFLRSDRFNIYSSHERITI